MEKIPVGQCEFCYRTTFNRCDQCLYFFCSIDCLKNDSKNHNDTCKRTRRERKKREDTVLNDGTLTFRKPYESGCEVSVVSILQPNIFYVRIAGESEDCEHLKNLDKIYNLSKSIKQEVGYVPSIGEVIFCKFFTRGYNRALVLDNTDHSNIVIVFVDFGNIHYVPLEEIYPISPEHFSIPRTVFPVKLRDVETFYANKSIREYLKSLVERDNIKLYFRRDQVGKYLKEVMLIDLINNENVNETIKEMRTFPEPDIHRDIFFSIPKSPIHELLTMNYVIMDTSYVEESHMISVIPKKDIPSLLEFQDEIQLYANKAQRYYTPR